MRVSKELIKKMSKERTRSHTFFEGEEKVEVTYRYQSAGEILNYNFLRLRDIENKTEQQQFDFEHLQKKLTIFRNRPKRKKEALEYIKREFLVQIDIEEKLNDSEFAKEAIKEIAFLENDTTMSENRFIYMLSKEEAYNLLDKLKEYFGGKI